MMRERLRTALIVLALLVASVGPAVGAGATDTGGTFVPSHDSGDGDSWNKSYNDTEPAGDAYVTEDGDVILRYDYTADGDAPETNVSGHAGVNVSAGMAHFVMTDNASTNVTGSFSAALDRESASMNGSLSAPRPDALDALQFEYVAAQNASDSAGSMDLHTRVNLSGDAGILALLQEARADGYVTTGPETLESNGSFSAESAIGMGGERHQRFVLTETQGGYTLDGAESIPAPERGGWSSEAEAKQTLQTRFCAPLTGTDATCSVTIDSFTRSDGQVSVDYTVEMRGVDSLVSSAVVSGLTESSPESNVSTEEATDLADHLTNVTVDHLAVELDFTGTSGAFTWNLSLSDSDDLVLAYADFLELSQESFGSGMGAPATSGSMFVSPGDMTERLVAQVEAQKAADFAGTTTWSFVLTPEDGAAVLNASVESETTNWADYVTELESRDVEMVDSQRVAIEAETDGDSVIVDASIDVADEGWVDRSLTQLNETFAQMANASETDGTENVSKVIDAIETVRAANVTAARMDAVVTGEEVRIEGAAAVDNGSALTAELPGQFANLSHSYTDLDALETTVRLDGAVSAGADEEAVRDLELVGNESETTVHLAGDWNRSFGSMNVSYVESYLGLAATSDDGGISMVAVAGGAVAVTAAIGGGLLLFGRGL